MYTQIITMFRCYKIINVFNALVAIKYETNDFFSWTAKMIDDLVTCYS